MTAAPLAPGQYLCLHCVYALLIPTTQVEARGTYEGQDAAPNLNLLPGLALIEAARTARDEGYALTINSQPDAGIYADLTFRGDTVCAAHLWVSIEQARGGRGFQW